MRKANRLVLGLALYGALAATGGVSEAWDPATLAANGAKVADYALAHPTRANHRDWTYGTFYAGLTAFALAHPERPYLDILRQEGTNNAWRLDGGRPFYAETHGIGQTWLELARVDDDPAAAAPTRAVFDYILENRSRAPVVQRLPNGSFSPNLLRWAWSDALFMSPPVWAKLAALTGEARYRDFLIGEYRASAARLYDREAGLFYRDYAARAKRSAHGAPVFWGRGNGWVLGGLPLVLRELPPGLRTRPFFLDLFRGMSEKVKALQRADGAWSPNLLPACAGRGARSAGPSPKRGRWGGSSRRRWGRRRTSAPIRPRSMPWGATCSRRRRSASTWSRRRTAAPRASRLVRSRVSAP